MLSSSAEKKTFSFFSSIGWTRNISVWHTLILVLFRDRSRGEAGRRSSYGNIILHVLTLNSPQITVGKGIRRSFRPISCVNDMPLFIMFQTWFVFNAQLSTYFCLHTYSSINFSFFKKTKNFTFKSYAKGREVSEKKFYFHRAKQLRHKFVILKNLYQKLSARNKGLLRNKWNFAKNNKRITLCCRRQCWWHHMPLNCSWAGRWPISL